MKRLAAALGHPRRLRILLALAKGPGSASSIARKIGLGVNSKDAGYHLSVLVKSNAVGIVRTGNGRVGDQTIYALRPSSELSLILEEIPDGILTGLLSAWLGDSGDSP